MYYCQYCSKECKSLQSLRGHERLCKLNPNFEENLKKQNECTSNGLQKYFKKKVESDPLNQIQTYNLICSKCGKEYQLDLKVRLYNRGCYPKTCSSKCAHARVLSDKSKKQKLENLKKDYEHKRKYICKLCGKEYVFEKNISTKAFCSKEHYLEWRKNIKKYDPEYCKKLSATAKRLMAEGKIKPWTNRNIKSYAEKFFHKVLSLNNISYEYEVPESGYFLDFVIKTNTKVIDLEIDGKQHWEDKERAEHDKIRDKKLTDLGYLVYRIPWNSINTIDGKDMMRKKIKDFFEFLNSL